MRAPKVSDNPHVKWVIMPDGSVECEVKGVIGPSCSSATEATERALGVVIARVLKPEHYQSVTKKENA